MMTGRQVALYYAWSRPGEIGAPVVVNENRFPTLYESRRLGYPRFQEFSDPARFDQSVAGFLDHIMKANFTAFAEQAALVTGHRAIEVERVGDAAVTMPLDQAILDRIDTLIIISFDSLRTGQAISSAELAAVRSFLDEPDHMVFVCPHHDIGAAKGLSDPDRQRVQEAEFHHHGDRSIPSQQRFGGFARSLLAGLGVPVENQFGLRPAATQDGSPAPIDIETSRDRLSLLNGVTTFNLHPHLPHLHCLGEAANGLEVLARQTIDLNAPPHEFVQRGHTTFNALLQSRPGLFAADLLVSDATLWSGTAGGLESLRRLWANVVQRPIKGRR
jgi:hypothetical protein